MNKSKWILPTLIVGFFFMPLRGQMLVSDPVSLLQMANQFLKEAAQWKKQIEQWTQTKQSWTQELEHFIKTQEQWGKENDMLQKLLNCQNTNNLIFSQFLGSIGADFKWDDLRLSEIMDVIEGPAFSMTSGQDPYKGLFTKGLKIEEAFPNIRDWSEIQKSDKYRNNSEYKTTIDRLMEEQKRMLDDMENKIQAIAKLNGLVPEREKKLREIQKRFQECTTTGGTVNLPKLWVLSSEVNMELCRQMFHLVMLDRIETENMLLDELRTMNERKGEEKFDEKNQEKDIQVVKEMMTGKKEGGK